VTFAESFEREAGVGLEERQVLGVTMLVPADDRLGAFAIVVGPKPKTVFETRSYGARLHLLLWGGADEKQLDRVLRRVSRRPT
jgi:hypothetical protein